MFWKGPVFTKDGFTGEGINLETCSIANTLDGGEDGIIVPLFRNCHTHLGDTLARDEVPEGLTLTELVGPSGWKHEWLETNPTEASILAGMREIIASSGTAGPSQQPSLRYLLDCLCLHYLQAIRLFLQAALGESKYPDIPSQERHSDQPFHLL